MIVVGKPMENHGKPMETLVFVFKLLETNGTPCQFYGSVWKYGPNDGWWTHQYHHQVPIALFYWVIASHKGIEKSEEISPANYGGTIIESSN